MPSNRSALTGAKKIAAEGLTFDDVLLLPGHSSVRRSQVDLTTQLHPSIVLKLPILSSPMDTVTEESMLVAMAQAGGLGIVHRNIAVAQQAAIVERAKKAKILDKTVASRDARGRLLVGAAIGAGADMEERVRALLDAETDVIVVDSGHGDSVYITDAVRAIKKLRRSQVVMAGNVATSEGARSLIAAGADILRVGVGPGSICTTRIVTGVGAPQLFAVMEAVRGAKGKKVTLVADGGIRQMGDMAKALAAGAHAVMLGSMLAGHDEAPGEALTVEGKAYKRYRGMGSIGAMKKGGAERYGQSRETPEKKLIAEGVEGLVPSKGAVGDFLYQAGGALRSALYYVGAKNLKEFHAKSRFVRITNAGLRESHPHTITVTSAGASYL
ncbi:MAG: IMP dehydrogenase [Candidatus Peregrinibacteria bacterium Gr01-1014_25]|nr:MAG: IMP dehydrogenase [Candidatus Peregrinibacteria bacterium Gr01-1014_25]